MALVPDTTNFSLQDVVNVINPTSDDMVTCVAEAIAGYYDPAYSGNVGLLKFRNYGYKGAGFIGTDTNLLSWRWDQVNCFGSVITIDSTGPWTLTIDSGADFTPSVWSGGDGDTITVSLTSGNNNGAMRSDLITVSLDADPLLAVYIDLQQYAYLNDCV